MSQTELDHTPPPPGLRPIKLPWYYRQRAALLLKRRYADAFEAAGDPKTAKALRLCSESEHIVACLDCGRSWWVTYHCGLRCCPICSWRAARERQVYLQAITKDLPRPKHIVLTMPRWQGSPAEGITILRKAIAKLRRREIFKSCRGGALTIEVLPKPDGWHIHAHVLADAPFIPFSILKKEWSTLINIPNPHVSIQSAECDAARRYVAKYAGKSIVAEVGIAGIVSWYRGIKGKRLWGTFGAWFNYKLVEDTRDNGKPKYDSGCPYCGALKCVVPAECVPAMIGKGWRDWCTGPIAQLEWSRKIPEVVEYLDASEIGSDAEAS